MRFKRHLKPAGLLLAAGLCAGGSFPAVADAGPATNPPPQYLADRLWAAFVAATNGRSELLYERTGDAPRWNTNSAVYGLKGFTGLGYLGLSVPVTNRVSVPFTALTPRIVYLRGHSNGATNEAVDPEHFRFETCYFLTADNALVTNRVLASFKRQGGGYDYCLLLLSNDLPATIQPVCMADPAAISTKLAAQPSGFAAPRFNCLLGTCQHGYVCSLTGADLWSRHNPRVGGDSGAPDFYIYEGAIIMTGGRTTSGYSAQMQADADTLAAWAGLAPARCRIQTLDLSGIPDPPKIELPPTPAATNGPPVRPGAKPPGWVPRPRVDPRQNPAGSESHSLRRASRAVAPRRWTGSTADCHDALLRSGQSNRLSIRACQLHRQVLECLS